MQTNEDLKKMKKDMDGAIEYMDSEKGKEIHAQADKLMEEMMEQEKNDKVLYPITDRMIQGFAQEEIERELSEDEIDEVLSKICFEIDHLLKEAICDVGTMTELWESAIPVEEVEKHQNRFEIYARNELAYESEFSLICAYTEEEDARYYTSEHYIYPAEEYKIEEIKDGIRRIIVHHKNALNGGDGFHMDVHEEPKVPQSDHNLEF